MTRKIAAVLFLFSAGLVGVLLWQKNNRAKKNNNAAVSRAGDGGASYERMREATLWDIARDIWKNGFPRIPKDAPRIEVSVGSQRGRRAVGDIKKEKARARAVARESGGESLGASIAGFLGFVRFPTAYDSVIESSANAQGISPRVFKSMLISESSLRPDAVSNVGARGIAQFMPATWREWTRKFYGEELPFDDAFNPYKAIPLSARYLRWLLDQTRGEYAPALASYNGGIGNWARGTLPRHSWEYAEKILKRAGIDSGAGIGV